MSYIYSFKREEVKIINKFRRDGDISNSIWANTLLSRYRPYLTDEERDEADYIVSDEQKEDRDILF